MPKPKPYTELSAVSIELDGKEYNGFYRIEDQGVTVMYDGRSKWAMLHASPAELLARMLLRELVQSP